MTLPPRDRGDFSEINVTVGADETGVRLDHFVAAHLPEYSRSTVNQMIRLSRIQVNGSAKKPGQRLQFKDHVTGKIPAAANADSCVILPEPLDLDVLYEDDCLLVVNKPPGLVVHPAPGHPSGTLVHGLCYHYPEIKHTGPPDRPGIVHRLDKDTSGLLLVAKTEKARSQLAGLFQSRKIEKTYLAFVYGNPADETGRITHRISRHKKHRKKMAISPDPAEGRNADTTWRVLDHYNGICLLQLSIKTGRTHQIRVHCAAIGHPLVGDHTYGYKRPLRALNLPGETAGLISTIHRQMLHASTITFSHPETGLQTTVEAPLPADMTLFQQLLKKAL
ncbi:MAG: RluA family pseudouridine synthase [Desulfosalsimonadaceae bacterium]